MYHSLDQTSPESIQFTVVEKNNTYFVTGTWTESLDKYRFTSDFLLFFAPNNIKIMNVTRERVLGYEEKNTDYLKHAITDWFEQEIEQPNRPPQIFDIKAEEDFQFSFTIPKNVRPKDIEIYYSHARAEPMDSLQFWFKKVELE